MKTIAYRDLASPLCPIMEYKPASENKDGELRLWKDKTRLERITEALTSLKHVGRIALYLVDGNKIRRIASHGNQ